MKKNLRNTNIHKSKKKYYGGENVSIYTTIDFYTQESIVCMQFARTTNSPIEPINNSKRKRVFKALKKVFSKLRYCSSGAYYRAAAAEDWPSKSEFDT